MNIPADSNDRIGRAGSGPDGAAGYAHPSLARVAGAVAVAVLAPIALAIVITVGRDHLPDPLPTHWGTHGDVDGYTSRGAYGVILLGIAIAGAVAAVVIALLPRLAGVVRRACLAVAGIVAWGGVGVWAISGVAAWNATDATTVELHPVLFLLLLVPVLGGVASHLAFGRAPSPPLHMLKDAEVPVARLAPGERVAWSSRLGGPLFLALGVILLGLAVLIVAIGAPWEVAIPLVLGALLTSAFASVRLMVDRRGLSIGAGPLPWLGKHIPLDHIDHVSVVMIEPMQWGGWGYRVMPGRSALVLRRGPGLVIDLTDGRRFAVTVDDPATPAALLNALCAAQP